MNQIKINSMDMAELRELGKTYNMNVDELVEMAISSFIDGAQNGALEIFNGPTDGWDLNRSIYRGTSLRKINSMILLRRRSQRIASRSISFSSVLSIAMEVTLIFGPR